MQIKIKGNIVTLTSENRKEMEAMMKFHLGLGEAPAPVKNKGGRPLGSKGKRKYTKRQPETLGIVTTIGAGGRKRNYSMKKCPICGDFKKNLGLHVQLKHEGKLSPLMQENLKKGRKALDENRRHPDLIDV